MKRILFSVFLSMIGASFLFAQDEEKGGFKKENLFTGGSLTLGLGFSSNGNTFSIGVSPIFGYSLTKWLDAGVIVNYTYLSYHDLDYYGYGTNDKVHQSVYGGGGFIKLYPISFLFAQVQFEHNFNTQKVIPGDGTPDYDYTFQTNSLLVGGGYASRMPGIKSAFFYLALLFDVSGVPYTPYTDYRGAALPILRAGIQVPLFQGKNKGRYEDEPQGTGGKKPRNYDRY